MLWLILSLPLLVWLWLGMAYTITYVALCWAQQEMKMTETKERARLIRYTKLGEPTMPGLLSFFEEEKNILHIDRELAATLPTMDRERLEMTHYVFTRLASVGETGLRFKPMVTMEVTTAAQ